MTPTDDELRALGKELPWERPDASRREAVRSALLVAAKDGAGTRAGRPWWLAGGGFVAGAAAAAIVVLLLTRRDVRPPDEASHADSHAASIEASAQANFEREVTTTAAGTDEIVHLHAGKVRLAVGALSTGDRVRVETGNAEVEGAGDYEVAVAGDTLREVSVRSGSAKITVSGEQSVFLAAGQTWTSPVVTAEEIKPNPDKAAPATATETGSGTATETGSGTATRTGAGTRSAGAAPASDPAAVAAADPAPAPAPVAVTAPAPASASGSDLGLAPASPPAPDTRHAAIERYFQAGYALLRANKPDEAARELAAAADLDPDDALAADARYFEGVALARAKRPAEAEHALIGFLDHAKTSLRRGRASILLGHLLADRGDTKSARAWFDAAATDPDPGVVAAARAGLAALP